MEASYFILVILTVSSINSTQINLNHFLYSNWSSCTNILVHYDTKISIIPHKNLVPYINLSESEIASLKLFYKAVYWRKICCISMLQIYPNKNFYLKYDLEQTLDKYWLLARPEWVKYMPRFPNYVPKMHLIQILQSKSFPKLNFKKMKRSTNRIQIVEIRLDKQELEQASFLTVNVTLTLTNMQRFVTYSDAIPRRIDPEIVTKKHWKFLSRNVCTNRIRILSELYEFPWLSKLQADLHEYMNWTIRNPYERDFGHNTKFLVGTMYVSLHEIKYNILKFDLFLGLNEIETVALAQFSTGTIFFQDYIAPFGYKTWLMYVISLILFWYQLYKVIRLKHHVLVAIQFILETEVINIDNRKIMKYCFLLVPFMFAFLTFTNTYKKMLYLSLIKPLDVKIESFEQIVDLSYQLLLMPQKKSDCCDTKLGYSGPKPSRLMGVYSLRNFTFVRNCGDNLKYFAILNLFTNHSTITQFDSVNSSTELWENVLKLNFSSGYYSRTVKFKANAAKFATLLPCNKTIVDQLIETKSFLIGPRILLEITQKQAQLKSFNRNQLLKIIFDRNRLFQKHLFGIFYEAGSVAMPNLIPQLNSYSESGRSQWLLEMWKFNQSILIYSEERQRYGKITIPASNTPFALKLNSKIQSIFYILSIGLIFASLFFIQERFSLF